MADSEDALKNLHREFARKPSREKLTNESPAAVAAFLKKMNEEVPHSWVQAFIFKYTMAAPEHRAEITPDDVILTYENGISADTNGMSRESGAAFAERSTNVLDFTQADRRLAISPSYVFEKFMDAVRRKDVSEAVVRFESTEKTPDIRKAFNAASLAELARTAIAEEKYDGVMKVLLHTQNDRHLRRAITPEMLGLAVKGCLQKYNEDRDYKGVGHPHYSYVILKLLELTVNDARLRAGIDMKDIDRLKDLLNDEIDQATVRDSYFPAVTIKHAQMQLKCIDYASLTLAQREDIGELLIPVLNIIDASTYRQYRGYEPHPHASKAVEPFDLRHYYDFERILKRYPEAAKVAFKPYQGLRLSRQSFNAW